MNSRSAGLPPAPDKLIEDGLAELSRMAAKCGEKYRDYKLRTNILRWAVIILGLFSTLRDPIERAAMTNNKLAPVWPLFFALVGGVTVLVTAVAAKFRWEDKIAQVLTLKQKCDSAHRGLRGEWFTSPTGTPPDPKPLIVKLNATIDEIKAAALLIPINL